MNLSEATLIGTTLEAFLYGFSILMFILTMCILLQRREDRKPNYWIVGAACVIQILALGELIVNGVRLWQAVVNVGPNLPGGADAFIMDLSHPTNVAKGCLYGAQTLILDGVVIYRTYVVWNSMYPVILPMMAWCALLASVIASNTSFARNIYNDATVSWVTAIFALTLGTNLSASILLAYRIWSVNRETLQYRTTNRLKPVLYAVIESGSIYSATVTIALILFLANSVGVYVVLDMTSPIICIVFNMIVIRVAFAADKLPGVRTGTGHPGTTIIDRAAIESAHERSRRVRVYASDGHELKALAVQITRHVETDVDKDGDGNSMTGIDRKVDHQLGDDEADSWKRSTTSGI